MRKLSIIIPTFNSSLTIQMCLRSISSQIFTDYEIIVQDGGSCDNTIGLIRAFQQENPQIKLELQQEADRGAYDAMNKGISRASGEWLYFLGSDDELSEPTVLSRTVGSEAAAFCNVLYGNVKIIGCGHAGLARGSTIYDGPFDLEKLLTKNICHQALFYRADFVREIGAYNVDYFICGDWDFNLRCFSKTAFNYVDVIVANFNTGGLSGQHRPDKRFIADIATNAIRYFNLSIDDPLLNTPAFIGFGDIVRMRQSNTERALRALVGRLKITPQG